MNHAAGGTGREQTKQHAALQDLLRRAQPFHPIQAFQHRSVVSRTALHRIDVDQC
jgi:hypothetical protein